ncbi:MAG: hypothetical protein J6P87_06540, partial [Lachnospiraceae bacterium]|nr:hypothetical protein [Lachnospiraceae bacterium]
MKTAGITGGVYGCFIDYALQASKKYCLSGLCPGRQFQVIGYEKGSGTLPEQVVSADRHDVLHAVF